MDWCSVGFRIRKQREYLEQTREQFAELIDVTPKFISDIELGVKGMSVPTLCRISAALGLSLDYIMFGNSEKASEGRIEGLLSQCTPEEYKHAENLLKVFFCAIRSKPE